MEFSYPTTYEYVDPKGDKHTKDVIESREPDLNGDLIVYVNPLDFAKSDRIAADDKTASGIASKIGIWFVFLLMALYFFWLFTAGA